MNPWKNLGVYLLMGLTLTLMTVSYGWFPQNFLHVLPLYISVLVMLLQSFANRYAFLLGAANSLLYAGVYAVFGLYAMALYALLVSCPLQIATFVRWSRRRYGSSTYLKKLSLRQLAVLATALGAVWLLLYGLFSALGSRACS